MTEQRFAVVRLGSLGDIVHTFPAVAALRESYPAASIIWLTHPRWKELVSSSGLASEIWSVDSRDLSSVRHVVTRLRQFCPEAAIDFQGLWKSAFPAFLAGISRRVGFSSATIREFGVPILYTDRVQCHATHIAEQNGELCLCVGAIRAVADVQLRIAVTAELDAATQLEREGIASYVVLSPGGGWQSKCWPPERFGALCLRIREGLGLRCLVNYGPGEEGLFAAVQVASGAAGAIACNEELGQLMAVMKKASCVVGGDTGPLHLAAALRTPVVALFGPTDPARNGPYPPQDSVLRSPRAVTSYKRGDTTDESLLDLSVEEVFSAVKKRVEEQA